MKPPKREDPPSLHTTPNGRRVVVSAQDPGAPSEFEKQYFQNYTEYSKTLRAWLVAYGIGGPVLFLTNKDIFEKLKNYTHKDAVIDLFLIGVALQVLLAFINKWCAWQMYAGENEPKYRERRAYKFWSWVNDQTIIDLTFDGTSLIAFSISTLLAIKAFS